MKFGLVLSDLSGKQVTEIVKLLNEYEVQVYAPVHKVEQTPEPAPEEVPQNLDMEFLKKKTIQLFPVRKDEILKIYAEFGIKILTELKEENYSQYANKLAELEADLN